MIVYKLTPQQADELRGTMYAADSYFNPIQDANDDWIISVEEVEATSIEWVKDLPPIEYVPKISVSLP